MARITDVFEYYFQALKKTKYIFIAKTISLLLIVTFQYYGVIQQYNILYFATLIVVDFFIQGSIYAFIFRFKTRQHFKNWPFSKVMAKHLIRASFPLILSNILVSFYISIDDFVLKFYYNDKDIGLYSTIYFLVITLTWSIGFAVINALFPALTESYNSNKKEYANKLNILYKYMLLFGIAIGVFYTVFGDTILNTFFNNSYNQAKLPLKIFSWSPLLIFIGMIFEKHLINSNQLNKNVYRFTIGCFSNLILSFLLIPNWGILGAVIAVLISHFITNIGFILFDSQNRYHLKLIFLK